MELNRSDRRPTKPDQGSRPAVEDRTPGEPQVEASSQAADLGIWRERAMRLGAEMENYRKRQQHLAHQQIAEERERLLRPAQVLVSV